MKKHIYNFIANSLPFIVALVPTIIAIPIYLKFLGASQMGIYYLYMTLTGIGGAFDLGISQTIIKYVSYYRSKSDYFLSHIIGSSRSILYLLITAFGVIFVFYLIGSLLLISKVSVLTYFLFFIGFSLQFILNFELAISRGYELFKKVAIYEIIQKLFFTALGITLAIVFKRIELILLIHIAVTLIIILYIRTKENIIIKYNKTLKFNIAFFKRFLLGYSKWIFLQNLIGFLNGSLDTFLVATLVNLRIVTSYNTALGLTSVFQGFASKGMGYLLPYASRTEDKESLRKFFVRGNFILSIILGVVYIIGTLVSPYVIGWYLKSNLVVAHQVTEYFDVLLIASLFACTSVLSWHLFNGMGQMKINTTLPLIFNIIGLVIMVAGGYFYGIWGIVYSKLFATLSSIIIRTISYNKVFEKRDYLIGLKLVLPLILCIAIMQIIKYQLL